MIPNILTQTVAPNPERPAMAQKTKAAQPSDKDQPSFDEAVRELDQKQSSKKEEIVKGDQSDSENASGAEGLDADIAHEQTSESLGKVEVSQDILQEPDIAEPFKMPKIPEVQVAPETAPPDPEASDVKEYAQVEIDDPEVSPALEAREPTQRIESVVEPRQVPVSLDMTAHTTPRAEMRTPETGASVQLNTNAEKIQAPPKEPQLFVAETRDGKVPDQPGEALRTETSVAAVAKEAMPEAKHTPIAAQPVVERSNKEFRTESKSHKLAEGEAPRPMAPTQPESQSRPTMPTPVAVAQPQAAEQPAQMSLYADADAEIQRLEFGAGSTQTGGSQANATFMSQAFARAEMPRSLAFQLQEAARGLGGQPVDVSLHPEELGRVRLSIAASELGVSLQILAERPETLDIMRRHAEMLAKELGEIGFASIDLAFGQGHAPQSDEQDASPDGFAAGHQDGTQPDTLPEPGAVPAAVTRISDQGVDIRI